MLLKLKLLELSFSYEKGKGYYVPLPTMKMTKAIFEEFKSIF